MQLLRVIFLRVTSCALHAGCGPLLVGWVCTGAFASPTSRSQAPNASDAAETPVAVHLAIDPTPAVTRAELEAHVRFLASDELAGRFTGSAGADRAARYIALVLERQGVEPAGDSGTFLQSVPMYRAHPRALPELKTVSRAGDASSAVHGRDFEASSDDVALESVAVVTVKTAEQIPREGGAKVALFVDAPASRRRQWLADAGHPGGEGFALVIQSGSEKPGTPTTGVPEAGAPTRAHGDGEGKRTPWIRVRGDLLQRLRQGDIASLSLTSHVEREAVVCANVVGRIRGVTDEAVVISAHYDHLHERPPTAAIADGAAPPDAIFNGADDDASGVAAVLELAGALAAEPKPERTLVFLLATGEEIGLLGTSEYLDHPCVPLAKTVANLNFEMIGRPDPLVGGAGVMWFTGYELTNLGPAYDAAGLAIQPDPRPGESFFQRSDNYAFVMRSVVGQTFSTYNMHTDYHTPRDEAARLDFAHMETCTKVGLEAVSMVCYGKIRPSWIEGKQPKAH